MDRRHAIDNFFHSLEKLDFENLLKSFTHNAVVHTPIRANAKVNEYFRELLLNTKNMKIKTRHIYQCEDDPNMMAMLFTFTWELPGGTIQDMDAASFFTFELNSDKIADLKVVYNAAESMEILQTAIYS